jgi:iron complex outermembrane receptor protein
MANSYKAFKGLALSSACFAALAASTAYAQDAKPANDSSMLEEVVVTAQFREQRLQDVPLSITAFSNADLEKRGADQFADYARSVPGLTFANRGANRSEIVIRGMSRLTGESTVGLYLDGVPQSNAFNNPDFRLFDVDRVEVLRGPQGTLYGEGSLGGTIKIFTTKPDPSGFEAKLQGTVSATKDGDPSHALNAMVNLPLAEDKAALRLSAYLRHDGGYVDNRFDGEENINTTDDYGFRAALRLQPTENVDLQFIVNHQHDEVDNLDVRTIAPPELFGLPPGSRPFDRYEIFLPLPLSEEQDNTQFTALADFKLGFGKIESMVGYNVVDDNRKIDSTTAGLPPGFETLFTSDGKIFVTEHRFISEFDGPFNFVAGIFYRDRDRANVLTLPGVGPIFFGLPGDYVNKADFSTKTSAVFVEGYYVAGGWTATAGVRYFSEKVATPGSTLVGDVVLDESDTSETFRKATPKFGLSYKASEDLMFFGNIAQGFRSGGTNPFFSADPNYVRAYKPDLAWSYELGVKSQWLDRRLTANATAFYIDWTDLQIMGVPENPALGFTTNAGRASSRGFELELKARPTNHLDLSFGVGYVDAHLDEPAQGAAAGDPLPGVPKWNVSASAEYTWPVFADYNGTVRVDYTHRSETDSDVVPDVEFGIRVTHVPSSENVNLRLGLENDKYGGYLFVNNLTDDIGITVAAGSGQYISRPRTFGLTLRAKF